MTWRRKLCAPLAVLLGIGVVGTAVRTDLPVAPVVAPAPITHSANATVAMAAARRQHQPVEVTPQETPTRKVTAQPNGTMTAELSASPMQVKRGDAWIPIDPAL